MEIIENGVVYRVTWQNGIMIKEYVRQEKSIELSYNGDTIHVEVKGPRYDGPLTLTINGVESIVTVEAGTANLDYQASGYDVITATMDGYADGTLTLGTPPHVPTEIELLQQKVDVQDQQIKDLTITLGDFMLGGI